MGYVSLISLYTLMTSISIVTWNVNGCRDALKRHDVIIQNADLYFSFNLLMADFYTLTQQLMERHITYKMAIHLSRRNAARENGTTDDIRKTA